jgi:arylsulfatase A-like enzyme
MDLLAFGNEMMDETVQTFIMWKEITPFIFLVLGFITVSVLGLVFIRRAKIAWSSHFAVWISFVFFLSCSILPHAYTLRVNNLHIDTTSDWVIRQNDVELYKSMRHKNTFFRKFGTFPLLLENVLSGKPFGGDSASIEELLEFFNGGEYYPHIPQRWAIDEGNNVIVVMMESVESYMIHPIYTPTLYNLRNQGIDLANFHSKQKTDVSEAAVVLGSYPSNKNFVQAADDWLTLGSSVWDELAPNTGGELTRFFASTTNHLRANGFDTARYFHPNFAYMYRRYTTHPAYGFDMVKFIEDYQDEVLAMREPGDTNQYRWETPERWFIDAAKNEIMPTDKRFFSFITTINSHGDYKYSDLTPDTLKLFYSMNDANLAFHGHNKFAEYKVALAKTMQVDLGVKFLMEELGRRICETDGVPLADKTTLVFYTDHLSHHHQIYELKNPSSSAINQSPTHQLPAFIYSPNLSGVKVEKFTNPFDLVPTIFQLLGIEARMNRYFGYCVFDTENTSVIYSKTGGILNDKFFTDDATFQGILWRRYGATDNDFRVFQTEFLRLEHKMRIFNALYDLI